MYRPSPAQRRKYCRNSQRRAALFMTFGATWRSPLLLPFAQPSRFVHGFLRAEFFFLAPIKSRVSSPHFDKSGKTSFGCCHQFARGCNFESRSADAGEFDGLGKCRTLAAPRRPADIAPRQLLS